MNKAEIVAKMAKEAKISKGAADKALISFIDGVGKTLKKGQNVSLVGFGIFTTGKRKARKGRNPLTGKEIRIPAKKVAKFKPGRVWENRSNNHSIRQGSSLVKLGATLAPPGSLFVRLKLMALSLPLIKRSNRIRPSAGSQIRFSKIPE